MAHGLTLGVEEELFVADPTTRTILTDGQPVFDRLDTQGLVGKKQSYDHEMHLSVIEARTEICQDLGEVRAELRRLRTTLVRAAVDVGCWVVAAGTFPLADWRNLRITPKPRYERMVELHQQLVREQAVCGCHVHVGISDRETAVQVLNRVRPWLPALLALSASSPFWMGTDSGYASYRTIQQARWPAAGPPSLHRSAGEYRAVVQSLINTDTILDVGQIYWDVRLGNEHGTLEFRAADVCTTVDEAVLQAGLCRALARSCLDEATSGEPLPDVRPELLRAAAWRAARAGLNDRLLDVLAAEAVPASVLLDRFLAYLRPALEDAGDWDEVVALVQQTQRRGASCQRQRRAFAQSERLEDVVDLLATETVSG